MSGPFQRSAISLNFSSEIDQGNEWFLGYDSECSQCSSFQTTVDNVAGGVLATISLHNPIAKRWREQALGSDAPWAPTLFRIRDGKVQAWVGKRIAIKLAALLGPRSAWKLAEAIADAGVVRMEDGRGLDRRTLIRGLGGVAAGVALLNVSEVEAEEAGPLSDHVTCNVNWTLASGYYTVLSGGANCRRCPRTNSPVDAFIGGGTNFHYRGYTSNGEAIWDPVLGIMNSYWWRSSGPTGCWVSGTRLP